MLMVFFDIRGIVRASSICFWTVTLTVNVDILKSIPTMLNPPYSPDIKPGNFFLFPKINSRLKQTHDGDVENVKEVVTVVLNFRVLSRLLWIVEATLESLRWMTWFGCFLLTNSLNLIAIHMNNNLNLINSGCAYKHYWQLTVLVATATILVIPH